MKFSSTALITTLSATHTSKSFEIASSLRHHTVSLTVCHASNEEEAHDKKRRTLFDLAAVNSLPFIGDKKKAAASNAGGGELKALGDNKPIADFPMRRCV